MNLNCYFALISVITDRITKPSSTHALNGEKARDRAVGFKDKRSKAMRRKKTFACGHKGYGQKCHRCAQEKMASQQAAQSQAQKRRLRREWQATFEQDPIDLTALPKHVVVKARAIIAGLQSCNNYTEFGGKRLRHNRLIVSIPITRHYRMICRDRGSDLVPQKVLSHEDYNVCKPGS